MADLKTLREERANIITQSRSLIDEADGVKDETRAAELEAQADKALDDVAKLDTKIERMEKVEALEARAREAADKARQERRPNGSDGEGRAEDLGGEITYKDAFFAHLRAKANDEQLAPEMRAVLKRGYQQIETRAQTTTAAAGGYTVPQELFQSITKSMLAYGPMYDPGVTRELVTSGGGKITMPTVNDTAVTAEAHTEGATLTDDGGKDVTFGEKQLDAFAFNTEWLRISKELMDDSDFVIQTVIADLLGERLGRIANLQLTTGSGSSAPNGIVTASTEGVEAAATAAITGDEIIDLIHSVDPAYRTAPTVRFMFNDSTLKAIRKLKDGDGNYLWQMGNIQQGVPGSLLGYNYTINQQVASLGAAAKVMLFGDFGKYYVRKVGAPLIGAIQDKDFWPGVGIAGYIRFDGELSDTAAVKHLITAAS